MVVNQLDVILIKEDINPNEFDVERLLAMIGGKDPAQLRKLADRGSKGIYPIGVIKPHSKKDWISWIVYRFGSIQDPREWIGSCGDIIPDHVMDRLSVFKGEDHYKVDGSLPVFYDAIVDYTCDMKPLPRGPRPHITIMGVGDYKRLNQMGCVSNSRGYSLRVGDLVLKPADNRLLRC